MTGRPVVGAEARRLALEVLARVEDDGAYANLALSAALGRSGLSERDRRLVTDLVYGTLRRRRAVDHLVDRFLTSEPPPAARRALRLGAYQLAYRTDLPTYAVVSATVEATPRRYRPLVNAVLRRVADAPLAFPDDATRLSYPDWVVDLLVRDLGPERALAALEAMDQPARVTVRDDGYTQDLASQWVAELVEPGSTDLVVDLCAAPGGKATALARRAGHVVAVDVAEHRAGLIRANAQRLEVESCSVVVGDARRPPIRGRVADRVLLDAPCSGLGVLRRRPDARWRLDADAPGRLAELQRMMVDAAVGLLRPGGLLVYSVCTLTAAESLGVDDHVAATHPRLVPLEAPGDPWEPWGRGAILLPQAAGTDGMCLFRYRYHPPDVALPGEGPDRLRRGGGRHP